MLTEGAAVGTANLHIDTVNSWLEFAGRREFQIKPMPHEKPSEMPPSARTEYQRPLEMSRTLEDKRSHYIRPALLKYGNPCPEIA